MIIPAYAPLIMHIALATGLSLRILYRKLQVNAALAWIVLLIAMPLAGPVLYIMFGDPTLGQRRLKLGQRVRHFYQKAYALARADSANLAVIPAPFDGGFDHARQRLSRAGAKHVRNPVRRG